MSATIMAKPRLRRRSLERTAMTPEQELELLIAEQESDDTYYVDRHDTEISLDAPTPDGKGTIGDLVGVDEGEMVVFFQPRCDTRFDGQKTQHGTIYGYRRLRCRCVPCTSAQRKSVSAYRARRKIEDAE